MNSKILLALLALSATLARGEPNPYYIGASLGYQHDSNLLRLGEGQPLPPGTASQSDSVASTTMLAGIDQPFGRQRAFGNLSASHNSFSRNTLYDNDSYALATGLDWATVGNLSGKLHYNANRSLARFNSDNVSDFTKNIQTTRLLDASVKLGGVGQLTFDADVDSRSVDYSAAAYVARNFRQDSLSGGMHYQPSPDAWFGFMLRRSNGRYPQFFDEGNGNRSADRFHRDEVDIDTWLRPSAASTVYLKLSPSRLRYDRDTQRDFNSIGGLARWNWQPTAKLRFEASLERAPAQDSYFQSFIDLLTLSLQSTTLEFSRVSTAARLRADYDFSSKLSFNASLGSVHRSLNETVDVNGAVSSGSETSNQLSLGGTWTPLRWLQAGCTVSNERRRGAAPLSSNLSDNTVSCYVQGTLQ